MSNWVVSIVVYRDVANPNALSHWALAVHLDGKDTGTLIHAAPIPENRSRWIVDSRSSTTIRSAAAEDSFVIARLAPNHAWEVLQTIRDEPPPTDGVENCQAWVLRAVISLEAEEYVRPGTPTAIEGLVGQTADTVARAAGARWTNGPARG